MKYIKPFIIEIFTTLLFRDKPIEVEKDYWWDEGNNTDENREERKPEPMPFFPYFENYLDEKKLEDIIIIHDKKDKNIITLENTNEAKNKLKKFLRYYINQYKEGQLEPDAFINYFPYLKNLDYMREVLYKLSDGFKQKKIVLYSYRLLREDKFRKNSDSLANEKIRLSEFLLDLYFQPNRKELILIKPRMKKGGIHALGNIVLVANIGLLEHPDTIYNTLAKQFIFEQSGLLNEKVSRMHLEFSCNLRKEQYSKNAYILLDKNKIKFSKEQYLMIHSIANKLEKFSSKKKTMKWNINRKVKEILKDKSFEFLIHNGSYYSLNEQKIYYNNLKTLPLIFKNI